MTPKRAAELRGQIVAMRGASDRFYAAAAAIGVHPFIELTGFMNEYISICERAVEKGIDFEAISIHSGGELPIEPHHAAYLGEKFGCIFTTTFSDRSDLLATFLRAAELSAKEKAARVGKNEPETCGRGALGATLCPSCESLDLLGGR